MTAGPEPRAGWGQRGVVGALKLYQTVRAGRPSPCRFDPSCSTYALEAVQYHGAWRGLGMSARRVARCHPWGGFGFDPVPPKKAI
jgi:putative membrane protein insertion efficiency factor